MKLLRIALFVVVVVAAALACLFLLPWLKEGHDIEELPLFAAIVPLAALGLTRRRRRA